MPDFMCVTKCYWGATRKDMRIYNAGEVVMAVECPNHHFEQFGVVEEQKAPEIDSGGRMIDWDELTKIEINERWGLNHKIKSGKFATFVKKSELIAQATAVMEKENGNR